MERIQVGDLVRSFNGGPLMSVDAIKDGEAQCSWFSLSFEPYQAWFPIAQLNVPILWRMKLMLRQWQRTSDRGGTRGRPQ